MPEIPESYRYYRADAANKTALDLIIASDRMPAGFAMTEWPTYYQVRLAAERVRTDFYSFMCTLWTETWGKALTEQLPSSRSLRAGDDDELDPSIDKVWSDHIVGNFLELPDPSWLWAEVDMPNDESVRLSFYVEEAGGGFRWSDGVQLSEPWLPADRENWRRTKSWHLDPTATSIDIGPLARAATEVAHQLGLRLR